MVMKRVFVECALHRPSVIGPGVIGPFIVGPPLLGRALLDQPLLGRATRPVAPTFSFGWTFDVRHILYGVVKQTLLDHRYWVGRYWTGRPDRSPLHSRGGHYWIAFWQNVKRRGLQCPSSHQNTVWWIRRAFSSDSQNTDWCRQGCWNNIPEGVGNGWVSFFCFRFLMVPFLLPSDLLTAPFF